MERLEDEETKESRGRVSSMDFGEETQRRTSWWRNRAKGGSTA